MQGRLANERKMIAQNDPWAKDSPEGTGREKGRLP